MRDDNPTTPSYYDLPILKSPVWKWDIASYFFFGGISGAAYTLARLAERVGGERYRDLTRVGTWTAFLSLLPCPPLLIHDLGDPKRFHHMLRVFKPSSPLNLGSWILTGYSAAATTSVIREYLRDPCTSDRDRSTASRLMRGTLMAVHDVAGVPLAMGLMSYTGVLLSCTANPMWCKNPWLGPLFAASSLSSGAAAINLAMEWLGVATDDSSDALDRIDTIARIAEIITLSGYLHHAGENARPLKRGGQRKTFATSIAALIAGEAIKRLPIDSRAKSIASSLATLAGGFALRWAMIHGGHEAAKDPGLSRRFTDQKENQPKMNTDKHR